MLNDDQPQKAFSLWQGYCYAEDIELTDHDQLRLYQLLCGRFSVVDYEHLHIANIQSIRCSDERRIIFSNLIIDNKLYLKVERILAHHEYERYFRHVNAQQALTLKTAQPLNITTASDILAVEVPQKNKPVIIPVDQSLSLAHYNQSVLSLNQQQMNAGKPINLPCLIEGAAGAGKTLTMLLLLNRLIEQLVETETLLDKDILVISPKPSLNAILQAQWFSDANPLSKTQAGRRVIFLSEDEFYQRYSPMAADGKNCLSTDTFVDIIRSALANTPLKFTKNLDNYSLLHEFQIMATCHDLEEYLNLGERESYLASGDARNERNALWQGLTDISNAMEAKNDYSPYITTWQPQVTFYAVLHDEAQTGYLPTKFILRQMAENVRYLLCAHSAQSTDKKLSVRSTLIKKLGVNDQPLNTHLLSTSYRNPKLVTQFNEFINQMRRAVSGGALDKSEAEQQLSPECYSAHRGTLTFIPSNHLAAHLKKTPANDIQTIVITRPEFIDDAIQRFGTGYVGTSANFGGQERKRVYLYRLTECQLANQANALLENFNPIQKDNIHLPKANKANPEFNILFAELYTGSSRTEEELYIVEREDHKRRFLLKHLKDKIKKLNEDHPQADLKHDTQKTVAVTPPPKQVTTAQEWLQLIDKFLVDNDIETAKRIWCVNLQRNAHDFEKRIARTTVETQNPEPSKTPNQAAKPAKQTHSLNTLNKQTSKTFYDLLDSPNSPSVKLLTIEKNGVIVLHEMFLQDKIKFRDYFNSKPQRLLQLSAEDWTRCATRSMVRNHSNPICLLALVLDELCEKTIPDFMIKVFSQNGYQLFNKLSFDDFCGKPYATERFPEGKSLIQLLLASDNAVKTDRPLNLACFYLSKHSNDYFFKKQNRIWFYDHFNLGNKKNARIAAIASISPENFMVNFIEKTFSDPACHAALGRVFGNGLKYYEYLLIIDDFSQKLFETFKEMYERLNTLSDKEKRIMHNIKELFTKQLSFTHMANAHGVCAPFLFHILNRAPLRSLLALMHHLIGHDLITLRDKKEMVTVSLLSQNHPVKAHLPAVAPITINSLRLLATIETIPLFLDLLLNLRGVLAACLKENNFLFETEVVVQSTSISLLYLFHREVIVSPKNMTGFQHLVEANNYLLLTHAPKDFILTIADYMPQRRYGHLLFENKNFNFIDHYYPAVKQRMSECEFSEVLFAFLFETKKMTNFGYITTFTALARNRVNHEHLLKIIAFIQPYQPVAKAIARCLNQPLETQHLSTDCQYYLWNGLATLLSDESRRDFIIELFKLVPEILTLIKSESWSHPDHPDILLSTLVHYKSGFLYINTLQETHPNLVARALKATKIPPSPAEQLPSLDTEAIMRTGEGLEVVADYIEKDPIGYFFTREEMRFEFLLSSVIDAHTPMMLTLAFQSPRLFRSMTHFIPFIYSEIPVELWLPINLHYYPFTIMTNSVSTPEGQSQFFAYLMTNHYQLLNRPTLSELMRVSMRRNIRDDYAAIYSPFEYLVAHLSTTQNNEFADVIIDLLSLSFNNDTFMLYLKNQNYASTEHIGKNNLYFFCSNANFMRAIIKFLATASDKLKSDFADALCHVSEHYDKHNKAKQPWSALSVLVNDTDYGISCLYSILLAYPGLIAKIPITAWSSPLTTKDNQLLIRLKKNIVVPEIYDLIINASEALKALDVNVLRYIALENTIKALPSQAGYFSNPTQLITPMEPNPCQLAKKPA